MILFQDQNHYGLMDYNRKVIFFAELKDQKSQQGTKWIVLGDFDEIYRARDKNRGNINKTRLNNFKGVLNNHELKELP